MIIVKLMNILYKFLLKIINLTRINRFTGLRSALSIRQKVGQVLRLIFTVSKNQEY